MLGPVPAACIPPNSLIVHVPLEEAARYHHFGLVDPPGRSTSATISSLQQTAASSQAASSTDPPPQQPAPPQQPLAFEDFRFPHDAHLAQEIACDVCHRIDAAVQVGDEAPRMPP